MITCQGSCAFDYASRSLISSGSVFQVIYYLFPCCCMFFLYIHILLLFAINQT